MSQKQMFAFRLSEDAIEEMEEIASHLYIPVRTMARQWIMQRLEAIGKEKEHDPAVGAERGSTTPTTGAQHTHGVVANV